MANKAFDTDLADRYKDRQGKRFEIEYKEGEFEGHSWTSIPVLEFLRGKPWNNLALCYVTGLRPDCIRVSTGCQTLDAWPNRVSVLLEDDGRTIHGIEMEVQVMLVPGVENGHDLDCKLDDPSYVHPEGLVAYHNVEVEEELAKMLMEEMRNDAKRREGLS